MELLKSFLRLLRAILTSLKPDNKRLAKVIKLKGGLNLVEYTNPKILSFTNMKILGSDVVIFGVKVTIHELERIPHKNGYLINGEIEINQNEMWKLIEEGEI